MDLLLETSVPEQPQRAAVAVGRFNPPTLGHYKVIKLMKKFIVNNPNLGLDQLPIVVVIDGEETGKDLQRNPLTA
jgi:nicotinamide mononucleotide adenylyltransferase